MDMNTKTTAMKSAGSPKTGASQALGDMAENGTTQAKETYEKMNAVTMEAAETLKNSCATAVKGAQDYNNKFMEFAQANTNAGFDFVKQLYGVKSPSAFVELSSEHARKQFETLTEQTKQLAALAQKSTLATTEPIKTGFAKAFSHSS